MAAAHDTKFSFLSAHGPPGSRKQLNYTQESGTAPIRARSLPQLGIPAGYSPALGNRLGLEAYANLRGPFAARLDAPLFGPNGGRHPNVKPPRKIRAEEWSMPERVRPENLPPAGMMKKRITGRRLVPENSNTLSHVDTLIWGRDVDGSDGLLKQADAQIYSGAAGLNAKAERTPAYGVCPPTCVRTFGPEGSPGDFEGVSYQRLDPRQEREG